MGVSTKYLLYFRLRQQAKVTSFRPLRWGKKALGACFCFGKKEKDIIQLVVVN